MRKVLFLSLSVLALASCSKNSNPGTGEPVSPQDAAAVSKAITVWHATRVQGNAPAPTNNPNGPQLDQFSNNQSIKAISGRYAVIQPEVTSGSVKGYYVQVNGASEYFKLDYSKPRTGGRSAAALPFQRNKLVQRVLGTDSTGNGTLDSSIVIAIPANVQPGQFCISYCAYDSLGNISNVISSCVTVATFGGDASTSYLNGTWHMTHSKDTMSTWTPLLYSDTSWVPYTCVNNQLLTYCPTSNCTFVDYPAYIYSDTKFDLIFGSNGGLKHEYAYSNKELNDTTSTCSTLQYNTQSADEAMTGAWSYNSTTNRLTLIFDFNQWGIPDPQAIEFNLQKISNTEVHLRDSQDPYGTTFKLVK